MLVNSAAGMHPSVVSVAGEDFPTLCLLALCGRWSVSSLQFKHYKLINVGFD